MQEMKPIKEGKVREIYDNGDSLIMVATDRISCFDVILNNQVTKKGTVLTQMSKFWFDMTEDILPNHMISVDVKDMPEFFQQEKFDGNSMMCRKLEMLPIECIVRGYITGSGWESYKKTGKVCGIELPEGLKESDKLPEPIYTPSTKAEIGDHDENISYEQSIAHLEKYFPGRGEELAAKLRDNTIALYKKCAEYALSKGIIIADTKFEFGLDENGNVVQEIQPTLLRETISESTSETLRQYMYSTVTAGTGATAKVDGYSMGGKTGTAQKAGRDGVNYLVSFIGFAPVDDPQLVIYCVVDEPNAVEQYHSSFAQNIVREILEEVLPYMNIYRDEQTTGIHAGWDITGTDTGATAMTDVVNEETPVEEGLDVPDTTDTLPGNEEEAEGTDTPQDSGDTPQDNGDEPQDSGDTPQDNGDIPQDSGDIPQDNGQQ